MAVNLTELTNGTTVVKEVDGLNTFTWEGTAVFDVLVRMVNENLKIQYDEGRIKATDYAQAYIAGLQTCITEAMKFIMQKDNVNKDTDLKQANIALINQQIANLLKDAGLKEANIALVTQQKTSLIKDEAVKDANIALLERQTEGFDDNKKQKLFEAQMNAWALMFSSGILESKPAIIRDDAVSALYESLTSYTPAP